MSESYEAAQKAEKECWLSTEAQELGAEAESFLQDADKPLRVKIGNIVFNSATFRQICFGAYCTTPSCITPPELLDDTKLNKE